MASATDATATEVDTKYGSAHRANMMQSAPDAARGGQRHHRVDVGLQSNRRERRRAAGACTAGRGVAGGGCHHEESSRERRVNHGRMF